MGMNYGLAKINGEGESVRMSVKRVLTQKKDCSDCMMDSVVLKKQYGVLFKYIESFYTEESQLILQECLNIEDDYKIIYQLKSIVRDKYKE